MKKVEFTKDFANKKKGEFLSCDGMLASQLVRIDKVAKYCKDTKQDKTIVKNKSIALDKK